MARISIIRLDFGSDDHSRTASIERVRSNHVPPLGVTWYLTRWIGRRKVETPDNEFTSRAAAEAEARKWCGGQS